MWQNWTKILSHWTVFEYQIMLTYLWMSDHAELSLNVRSCWTIFELSRLTVFNYHTELFLNYMLNCLWNTHLFSSSSDSTALDATPLVDSETSLLLSGIVSSLSSAPCSGLINPVVVAATLDLLWVSFISIWGGNKTLIVFLLGSLTNVWVKCLKKLFGPRQANLCLRAFRHDKF